MSPAPTLPAELLDLASRQEQLVGIAQCLAAGLTRQAVHRRVRAGTWARVTRGVYDTCTDPVPQRLRDGRYDHLRRRAAWVGLLAYPDGVATGACALALLGVGGLPVLVAPEVSRPARMDAGVRPGTTLRRYGTFPVIRRYGRDVAETPHALAQALLTLPRDNAVAVLGDALREGRVPDLREVAALIRGRRGAARARPWLGLVSPYDGSPAETFARLSFADHGVPPDGQQVEFWADGRFLGRVDFCWELPDGRYLVVEIDGREFHAGGEMLADDAARQNRLVGSGRLVLLRFPAPRSSSDGDIGRQVAAHLSRHGCRRPSAVPPSIDLTSRPTSAEFRSGGAAQHATNSALDGAGVAGEAHRSLGA
ncbi:MAG TPA: type IV toxin-antitoxin system AbiEi family antitoxin domain-containing protein [Promicromonospora sp.]|nr:type IV toxin-antitoxin system AbiEi family antitoxin domain-containing protein [Promicromonospora sp.]